LKAPGDPISTLPLLDNIAHLRNIVPGAIRNRFSELGIFQQLKQRPEQF
jgi:hypothetical protein